MVASVLADRRIPAAHGRTGFVLDHPGPWPRRKRSFDIKQVTAYAVWEDGGGLVITVLVKYFRGPPCA